jgi:4-amino-4-deoxy-L-arabinose transferase-like glycosyltransferase
MTLYKALTTDRLRDFAILGLAIGIAALFRSTPVLFPMFLFFYLLARGGMKQFSHTFIRCAVVSVVMLAVLSPWLVRNYEVAGVIGPRETVLGFSVYNGWYINNNIFSAKSGERLLTESVKIQDQLATDLGYPHKPGYFQYFRSIEDEVAFDRYLTNKVFGEYGEHPLLFARNSALNFVRFWFHGGEYIATTLNVIITLPLLLLAVAGIRTGLKEKINLKPILLLMAAIIVVHLPVLGVARHHVPFIPLLLLFSLIAVRRWIQIRLGKA